MISTHTNTETREKLNARIMVWLVKRYVNQIIEGFFDS